MFSKKINFYFSRPYKAVNNRLFRYNTDIGRNGTGTAQHISSSNFPTIQRGVKRSAGIANFSRHLVFIFPYTISFYLILFLINSIVHVILLSYMQQSEYIVIYDKHSIVKKDFII